MANLANLLATIAANVYTNHNNEVTAQMVKDALGAIVSTMGQGGYIYKGVATTSTNPSSPDANVFYIATAAGTYTNFGGIVVNAGEVAILRGTGTSWSKDVTGAATAAQLSELGQEVVEINTAISDPEALAVEQTDSGQYIKTDGDIASNANYQILLYDVRSIDYVRVASPSAPAPPNNIAVYAFYSGTPSLSTLISVGPGSTAEYSYDIKVPENARYLACSRQTLMSQVVNVYSLIAGSRLDDIDSEINSLKAQSAAGIYGRVSAYTEDSILASTFINRAGVSGSNANYRVLLYDLAGVDKVRVIGVGGNNAPTAISAYAFYSSSTIGSATLVQLGEGMTTNYDYVVPVPTGASYLAVVQYYPTYNKETIGVYKVADSLKIDNLAPGIMYYRNGNHIYVSVPFGDKQLVTHLGPSRVADEMGNGLMDFISFGVMPNNEQIIPELVSAVLSNTTDWFAPYKIKAINNIDGDLPNSSDFTGGQHRYNNTSIGTTPTARLDSVEFFADGKSISAGYGKAKNIVLRWTNYIQATNTKKSNGTGREVLKETITLSFDGLKWDVFNDIVPLEDVQLVLYYGYQMSNVGGSLSLPHWRFIGATNRADDATESGNIDANGYSANGATARIRVLLDESLDLGKRGFVSAGTTKGAFYSNNKLYLTIANNSATITADSHYYLKGVYTFEFTPSL